MKEKLSQNIDKNEKECSLFDKQETTENDQGKRRAIERTLKIESKSKNIIWGSPWEYGKIG